MQINPESPELNAHIKLHKINKPICLVINSIHAPTYNIAKILQQQQKEDIKLENEFIMINF
jgi:hypothetical protein